MTEDEAKQKWCPFVRVLVTPDTHAWQGGMLTNRGDIPASNTDLTCIGKRCMAWRSTEPQWAPLGDGSANQKCVPTGYCGLVKS